MHLEEAIFIPLKAQNKLIPVSTFGKVCTASYFVDMSTTKWAWGTEWSVSVEQGRFDRKGIHVYQFCCVLAPSIPTFVSTSVKLVVRSCSGWSGVELDPLVQEGG